MPEDLTGRLRRDEALDHALMRRVREISGFPLPEPSVIISMAEWRAYELFRERIANVEDAIARGRLEGKLQAYRLVLSHAEASLVLSPIRAPGVIEALKRIIKAAEEDLARLEGCPMKPPTQAGVAEFGGVPADQGPVPRVLDREPVPKGGTD